MKLSPRIIQAMEILQLPMLALQERIDAELQSNPVLEMVEPGLDQEAPPDYDDAPMDRGERDLVVDAGNGHSEDFQRLSEFEDEYGADFTPDQPITYTRPAASGDRDAKMDAMANTAAPGQTITDYLLGQWTFVECPSPQVDQAGRRIIEYVEEDGYLRTPLEDLVDEGDDPITLGHLRQALPMVQQLDPPGVAARDLRECLLIQLVADQAAGKEVSLEIEQVRNFLRDIERNRLPHIARRLGRDIEEIKAALVNLSHLNPRPGTLVGDSSAPVITPDVVVDLDDEGDVLVSMPDETGPALKISKSYRKLAKDRRADTQTRRFLRQNIRSAEWLIGAVEQRRQTVRRVTGEVFLAQKDFLLQGPEALKPLPMADVASAVGVHVATVSRAVAGTYVQTPRGIFPLRMFFSGGTTTAGGEEVSWDAVRVKLREVIDAEDKTDPLNDDQLVEELKKHGNDIARRTVAKYRGLMNIPPARKRREY